MPIYYHRACLTSYEYKYKKIIEAEKLTNCSAINNNISNQDNNANSSFDSDDDANIDSNEDLSMDLSSKELKSFAIIEEINSILEKLKDGKVFEISELRDNINQRDDVKVDNRDIKNYLLKNYPNEIKNAVNPQSNKSNIIFHANLKIEDVVYLQLPSQIAKQSANLLRKVLSNVNYNLHDRFCDATDLRDSLNVQPVPPFALNYFIELFNYKKNQPENYKLESLEKKNHISEEKNAENSKYISANGLYIRKR